MPLSLLFPQQAPSRLWSLTIPLKLHSSLLTLLCWIQWVISRSFFAGAIHSIWHNLTLFSKNSWLPGWFHFLFLTFLGPLLLISCILILDPSPLPLPLVLAPLQFSMKAYIHILLSHPDSQLCLSYVYLPNLYFHSGPLTWPLAQKHIYFKAKEA